MDWERDIVISMKHVWCRGGLFELTQLVKSLVVEWEIWGLNPHLHHKPIVFLAMMIKNNYYGVDSIGWNFIVSINK